MIRRRLSGLRRPRRSARGQAEPSRPRRWLSRSIEAIRHPSRRPLLVTATAGLLLVAASLAGVALLLQADGAPEPQRTAIGVIPNVPGDGTEGFAVAMFVRVRDCSSPVEVTVVTNGTAGYWRSAGRRARRWSPIAVTAPDVRSGSASIGLSPVAADLILPGYASTPPSDHIEDARAATLADGATAVDAFVYDWPSHVQNVVVRFEGDWLRPRGVGSCYLRLPPLVGNGTVLAALQFLGRTWKGPGTTPCRTVYVRNRATGWAGCYDRRLGVVQGAAIVHVDRGAVDLGASAPAPNQQRDGDPAWACESVRTTTADDRVTRPDIVRAAAGSSAAFERAYLTRAQAVDCAAVVAITMDNATLSRDVLVLVLGAIIGLGATLMVEPLVAALARRRRSRDT